MNKTTHTQQRAGKRSRAVEGRKRKLAIDTVSKTLYATDGSESVCFRSPISPDGELSEEEKKRLNTAVLRLYSRPDLALWEAFHACRLKGHLYERDPYRRVVENEHFRSEPLRCRACNATCWETEPSGDADGSK